MKQQKSCYHKNFNSQLKLKLFIKYFKFKFLTFLYCALIIFTYLQAVQICMKL